MLRSTIVLRILGLAALIYGLNHIRRHYLFQQYLHARQITAADFPTSYIKVLNESVARGEQPPSDFDYASTFTENKIPRTIHFIWFQNLYSTHDGGSQIPATISRAPELCRTHNPDYEINIWNATASRDFFATEYSWFLPTYDGYRYPIQRIDALKYFVLYHYGGVYMDLDIACRRPLDPLLSFPAWFPEASPLGVNNDLFAAAKGHPILKRMTQELAGHDINWIFPYLTIFWSTGPSFSSDVLKSWFEHYKNDGLEVTGGKC
jgi:inositol phosphorylceramide mannosyltransferase catalytic subunit